MVHGEASVGSMVGFAAIQRSSFHIQQSREGTV